MQFHKPDLEILSLKMQTLARQGKHQNMSMQTPHPFKNAQFSLLAKSKETKYFLPPSCSVSNQTSKKYWHLSHFNSSEKKHVPCFAYFSNQTFKKQLQIQNIQRKQYICDVWMNAKHKTSPSRSEVIFLQRKLREQHIGITWLCSHSSLHFSVQLKSFIKYVIFLRRKPRTAQSSCGCLITGGVQGQAGPGFEQPDLVKDVPAHSRAVGYKKSQTSNMVSPSYMIFHTCNPLLGRGTATDPPVHKNTSDVVEDAWYWDP